MSVNSPSSRFMPNLLASARVTIMSNSNWSSEKEFAHMSIWIAGLDSGKTGYLSNPISIQLLI